MFSKKSEEGYRSPSEGVRIKTVSWGERTLMAEFRLGKGHVLPEHAHPHEQTGYVVSGKVVMEIDGKRHVAEPGDSWCIAGDVPHAAEVLEDAVVIEVFSPVREDFLP